MEVGDVCKIRLVFTQVSKNNIVNLCKRTVGPGKVETSLIQSPFIKLFLIRTDYKLCYLTFWIAINLSNTCKGFESSFECANINDSENIKSVGQNIVEFLN